MDISGKIKKFLEKLQGLQDNQKKAILFTIVVILGLIMGYFWLNSAVKDFSKLAKGAKSISLPAINLSQMPQVPSLNLLQASTSGDNGQNPANQASDWKTYTNSDDGFEIKYPGDWQQAGANINNVWDDVVFCPKSDKSCSGLNQIYLLVYKSMQDNNNPSSYYLGTNNGFYFYLDSFPQTDQSIFDNMILTFKFIKKILN